MFFAQLFLKNLFDVTERLLVLYFEFLLLTTDFPSRILYLSYGVSNAFFKKPLLPRVLLMRAKESFPPFDIIVLSLMVMLVLRILSHRKFLFDRFQF